MNAGAGVGKLRDSLSVVDVRRLSEARRGPGDDGVVAERWGSIHCQVRLSAGAPCIMTSDGPEPAQV